MEADVTKVKEFFEPNKIHFVIPVYQRNYDWSASQCKQLLDDILEVGKNEKTNAHFLGSVVYIHDNLFTTKKIKELSIIDGQQRITTLALIFLVLRKRAKEIENEELVSEINETYLINKFVPEQERLKLRFTKNNAKAFEYLFRNDNNEEFREFSKLVDNFNYFNKRITEENYQLVLEGLSKLMFDENRLVRATPINDTYYIEKNYSNTEKFERIKEALSILGFEEELIIKYAENG